ncbi:MAG: ADP-glyceromanno-heptose 6-epimerase [Bacteroidetes bacterium]|nr:MAG: ADP-glyceromanno-heptose 6-epimerase [Bacteroidota bacterium]
MNKDSQIIVTGAAGFIGSYMVGYLNEQGYENLIIVDDFSEAEKKVNYHSKKFTVKIERVELFDWLNKNNPSIDFIFHLGARTDTTEFDYSIHEELNVEYSKQIWNYCTEKNIPLVYASSAATYGGGEHGYKDDHDILDKLEPLNPYGVSKNEFDKWALKQGEKSKVKSEKHEPPHWYGLKFFNVYGPNEYHKARMASVIFHAYNQITKSGKVKLFKSHKEGFKDGEQLRDFIYVKDVVAVCFWLMSARDGTDGQNQPANGLYNLGTGKARTFNDLIRSIYSALEKEPLIEYIDTPADIRDKYQYFTEADMNKLKNAGYNASFYSLEDGVKEYVNNFLLTGKIY